MSKEQIDTKNCKECLHFEACCKWTDFPKQIGFPTCRNYRKQEWISVEERLPIESGKYLVCTKNSNVYQTKFYSYGGHWGQKDKGKNITHWMPLPEPPKMKGGEADA